MNYLITGGTGFIGERVINYLCMNNRADSIYVLVRDEKKAVGRLFPYREKVIFVNGTLKTILDNIELQKCEIDYIIHCAAPTQSAYMMSKPVETFDSIVVGTRNILELARRNNVKSVVYLSSMEVYGVVEDIGRPRTEQELGEIDLSLVRSCYPLGKRMAEHYCHLYYQQHGVPVKIARLSQVFGKGIRLDDNRVFMQFSKAAVNGEDIVLKTDGSSIGNYCDTEDVVKAILTILENGEDSEVYNVVNEENTMSIRDMAELVAKDVSGGKIKVVIREEDALKTGYAPKTKLYMSSEKLRKLGWEPQKTLFDMYKDVCEEISIIKAGH